MATPRAFVCGIPALYYALVSVLGFHFECPCYDAIPVFRQQHWTDGFLMSQPDDARRDHHCQLHLVFRVLPVHCSEKLLRAGESLGHSSGAYFIPQNRRLA